MTESILIVGDTQQELGAAGLWTSTLRRRLKTKLHHTYFSKDYKLYTFPLSGVSSVLSEVGVKDLSTFVIPEDYRDELRDARLDNLPAEYTSWQPGESNGYRHLVEHLRPKLTAVHLYTDKYREDGIVNEVLKYVLNFEDVPIKVTYIQEV